TLTFPTLRPYDSTAWNRKPPAHVRARNRRFQIQKRAQLFSRTHLSARPLEQQTHRELVYCPLEFHERSQYFIHAHDETPSVAMRVHNPDCVPFEIQC